ncbi:uncharacterized protein [Chelonus insularis]|uniref:uncharacterized protein n=1 Tax=Chelonus insularis TaxID=460826 RepID=UPI00158BD29A|nr:uncharacterized protein LOC118073545 [Chelonus insularis]
MALSRVRCSKDLPNLFSQVHNSGGGQYTGKCITPKHFNITKTVNFHLSNIRHYPNAPQLTLPKNIVDIFGNETGRFTPERARDIAAPVLLYGSGSGNRQSQRRTWDSLSSSVENWGSSNRSSSDTHVDSYDCFGAISLNSSMQTMVPNPFCSSGKSSYLNMPGGQWSRDGKYLAEIMQKSHYAVLKQRRNNSNPFKDCSILRAEYSTSSSSSDVQKPQGKGSNEDKSNQGKLTSAQKLKNAVKDYGITVMVFHVSISLVSLGFFYLLVSSGLDVSMLVKWIPQSSEKLEAVMTSSSTFVIAYAIHKVLAPVRISITLTSAPFIVRYLRRVGILKMPKAQ